MRHIQLGDSMDVSLVRQRVAVLCSPFSRSLWVSIHALLGQRLQPLLGRLPQPRLRQRLLLQPLTGQIVHQHRRRGVSGGNKKIRSKLEIVLLLRQELHRLHQPRLGQRLLLQSLK